MRTTTPATSRARTALAVLLGAGLAAALGACGSSSGADEEAITSPEEWCDVARQVDDVVGDRTSRNTIHSELQDVYAEARILVVRLTESLEHVDADHRDDVAAFGEAALAAADALIEAPDQQAAEAAMEALYAEVDPAVEAGAAWVSETCSPR
ncbi:MAG: hypothetical protein ACLGI8_01960 [Acidimicrobiia bacterium]|jgi:hypothetical protein